MHIAVVSEEFKEKWDHCVAAHAFDGGILQSWAWGDFQHSLDRKVIRLAGLNGSGEIVAAALLIQNELHFEYNYLYCPRGPVLSESTPGAMQEMAAAMKEVAKDEQSFMIRLDPPMSSAALLQFNVSGLRPSGYQLQPKCVFMIDIAGAEEEMLNAMKQKTRYNIGLAKKRGVQIRMSTEISDIEPFWQLIKETTARDGFAPHPKEHYKKMIENLAPDGMIKLFLAEYDGKVVAAALVSFFGGVATYLHGASSDMYRDVMAPYLLQWEAILEAKRLGCTRYDFGGVNGESYVNKKWEGITRFKLGFNQTAIPTEYVGGLEIVTNPVIYSVYSFVKQIRG